MTSVRAAQNLLVTKTSIGSAQPVAAALDGEEWPEAIGTIAGDDTILIVCRRQALGRAARGRKQGDACLMAAKLKVAVLGATGYSGLELTRLLLRHPQVDKPVLLRRPESENPQPPHKTGKAGAPSENGTSISPIFFPHFLAMGSIRWSRCRGHC